jgi:hypothetical protein
VLSARPVIAALAASVLLGAPAAASAELRADFPAADRFLAQAGRGSQNLTPTPQVRPPRPSPAPAPSPPPAARPAPPAQLPYTGFDVRLLAAAGALLLLTGLGVRPRAADGAR